MSDVFLSLGSNVGQRRDNLRRAVQALSKAMAVTAVSPVYETAPWGMTEQPDFLNLCVAVRTEKSPTDLLYFIKALERELGRQPSQRWGPRLIDIDVLFYDDLVYRDVQLTIPHAHLAERAFVLAPLADIAPDFVHPQSGKTVRELLTAVDATGVHELAEPLLSNA